MKAFAKGIKKEEKLSNNWICRFNRLSTGPHLLRGHSKWKKVNSQKLKLPSNKMKKTI